MSLIGKKLLRVASGASSAVDVLSDPELVGSNPRKHGSYPILVDCPQPIDS
jgi:hypothetical protein